jgi:polysaccharide deacetylase 2 family uncharacterized protein YibQ
MVRRRPSPAWHLLGTAGLVLLAVLYLLYGQWQARPIEDAGAGPVALAPAPPAIDAATFADTLFAGAAQVLAEDGIEAIQVSGTRGRPDRIQVGVPGDLALALVNLRLTRFADDRGGAALGAAEVIPGRRLEVRCGFGGAVTTVFTCERDRSKARRAGQIAVVVGGVGQRGWDDPLLARFSSQSEPLTLALVPNSARAEDFAAQAREAGHEILVELGAGEVAEAGDDEEGLLSAKVRNALQVVPKARGLAVSAEDGTAGDAQTADGLLAAIRGRGMFYFDSGASTVELASGAGGGTGVQCVGRDLDLDRDDDQAAIEARLWELGELAAQNGKAVGLLRAHRNALAALEAVLPRLAARGHRVVPASQVAR